MKFSMEILPESSPANPTPSLSQVTSGSGSPENQRSYRNVFPAFTSISCIPGSLNKA